MLSTYNLTTAKAKLSSIISEVAIKKHRILISRKGKNVAAIIPFDEYQDSLNRKVANEGLILAKGALSGLENIDEFIDDIYQLRKKASERKVKI
jgi:prevent-host-death family protein